MKSFLVTARGAAQIGESLRRRRKLLGWSQDELAQRSGVRQKNVSVIEHGSEGAKLKTIFKLLAALDLELKIGTREKSDPYRSER